ncbi:MAG: twin-arginine translocation signal domain-containing protein, partial [Ilumatobacteraceae bacterium]
MSAEVEGDGQPGRLPPLTRRSFLGAVGIGAGALALPSTAQALLLPAAAGDTPLVIRRREDMLRLVIDSRNLTIDKASGGIRVSGNTPWLRISFGPQSIIERGEPYGRTRTERPVPARLSGPSHLTFRLNTGVALTLPAILAWSERELVIHQLATAKDGEDVAARDYDKAFNDWVTVIEMPWWLVLSPHREGSFTEQVTAKTRGGVTEVFHARLATGGAEGQTEDPAERTVRGVWIRDPQAQSLLRDAATTVAEGQAGYPWGEQYDTILNPRDRADIVRLTTRTGAIRTGGPARAVKARVALSPLGGHLDAEGAWDEPGVATLLSWRQRIWQGRDTYAKTVRAGLLYPWGIKAAYVEEGVRAFAVDSTGLVDGVTAFWQVRRSIIVANPDVDLAGDSAGTNAGKRGALFQSVHCRTTQTPPIEEAGPSRPARWADLLVFTPKVATVNGTSAFLFDLVGVDQDGNEIPFRQPLLFAAIKPSGAADSDPNFTDAGSDALSAFYDALPTSDKEAHFDGALVSFAPSASAPSPRRKQRAGGDEGMSDGDQSTTTQLPTRSAVFKPIRSVGEGNAALAFVSGTAAELKQALQPKNFPQIDSAVVYLEDTARVAGKEITTALNYPRRYLEDGFNDVRNEAQVFLQQAEEEATEIAMDAKRAGGVLVAKMGLGGLSRTLGIAID